MASPAGPTTQHVLVSYTAPPTFFASPNWNKVHSTILAQLPLRNIHWKSASRSSVRTIQELDVTLVSFESLREELTSQIPVTVLEKPLLHVYVLHCEDNDLETYKNVLKRYVKEWHTIVSSRKHQEWLILQIIRPDPSRSQTGKLFQMKNSVLDKLKADFNFDKRDRCIQLNWYTGIDNPLAWAEFVNKMKEGIVYAFDSAIAQREEEVKRSENQQAMPGWNFCTFFILKESLASSFEGMNLLEEAVFPYDELEAMFHRVSRERNMLWFGSLIHPEPNDDSQSLLSVAKKPYRDLMLANSISIFDFRIYLLARQCQLLAKMGRFSEITTKVGFFLGTLAKRLQEVESTLSPLWIEAWTYSSALSVVEQCNSWVTEFKHDDSKSASANAGKAELLDIARTQLNIFGIAAGHLPASPPFSISLSTRSPLPTPKNLKISNETLNVAIHNQQAFYELYVAVTKRAIDLYAKSGRRKFALKLHGCLAAFELHKGNLSAALNTFVSLPAHYSPHAWTSLEGLMLQRALCTHRQSEKPQDAEWVHMVLSFLKSYVENMGEETLIQGFDKVEYVSTLVESLKQSIETLDNDIIQPDHPVLSVQVSENARLAETRDGSYIDATVTNYLPCTLPAERITVILAGRDSEKARYECPIGGGCPPGPSSYTLFCPTVTTGSFMLDTSEISYSRLVFQSNHLKLSAKQLRKLPSLVRVPQDLLAVDVRISQSRKIVLGKPQSLTVVLLTGRNHVSKLLLKLSSPSVTFRCQQAVLQEDDDRGEQTSFKASEDCVQVEDVEEAAQVTFVVPHSDASALTAMKVNLEVEYTTVSEPSITRISNFSRVLITTLPLSVNVEDFFRSTRVISKFTISTTSHQHVRIAEARLDLPPGGLSGVNIQPSSSQKRVITVTPLQPASFLFALDSEGPVRESLYLNIKYRMLREEVEHIIEREVEAVLQASPSSLKTRIILVGNLIDALESDAGWVELYGITGELIVPDTYKEEDEVGELLKKVKQHLADHRHSTPPAGRWREIQIPVDVPFMNIVASVRIQVLSTPFAKDTGSDQLPSLYAGQPISALLKIHTSFHWGQNSSDPKTQFLLQFNIEEMIREWLVSGPKRGDFVAMDGATHTIPITLIALHHGEFSLPKVSVIALPVAGPVTMGSLAVPSIETYQVHGAEKVLILPRGGRSTFVVGMGPS